MKILGVIPARYASTRFPGKPLIDILGKSMIRRVYEQAIKAGSLDEVVVATDDDRIAEEVQNFGGNYIMTSSEHATGTDRCAEVVAALPQYDVVINIQGDEPFIDPAQIDLLASCFHQEHTGLATLVKKITSADELLNVSIPKVVLNEADEAIYFSRQTIPYLRGVDQENWLEHGTFYKHIGLYGYRSATLLELTKLPASALEIAESLEQLRWISAGYKIQTKTTTIETLAIDTPEDLEKAKERL
ncbi:3-deoxy-manno-octulosonate cytidylyltransferase [Pedobacter faecalis]|uniref:3-deoxy-manno-octulosonate cytidylyltransferase n=1 Tax=Pedobacter faecalis TaxID=3041495 RepID=UPI00254F4268|nr:3-deoxy-manno-octulosonate cytidylyltransferase [Pedobacter sp. ELA7]